MAMNDGIDDLPEPGCGFGDAIKQRIRSMENTQNKIEGQVEDLHRELYRNGYFEKIKRIQRWIDDYEGDEEIHETRSHRLKRDVFVAFIAAGASGLTTVILVLSGILG